jgi:hypothetical protein
LNTTQADHFDADAILELLSALADDRLTTVDRQQLMDTMRRDPQARATYIEHAILQSLLMRKSRCDHLAATFLASGLDSDVVASPRDIESDQPSSAAPFPELGLPTQNAHGFFSSGWPVAYLVASVIFAVALSVAALVHVSQPTEVVRHSTLPSPSGSGGGGDGVGSMASPLASAAVGRITGMVDCVCESGQRSAISGQQLQSTSHYPLATNHSVALGDRFALKSGLLEITYDSGAKVILQGPVTYEVESPTGGYLSVGKLTAKLEKRSAVSGQRLVAAKSEISSPRSLATSPSPNPQSLIPNPLFAVRTPTAIVTDLGTEFAVEVDPLGSTTSHVFVGRVKMQSALLAEGTQDHAILIEASESAHAEKTSADSSGQSIVVRRVSAPASGFIRAMPSKASTIPSPDDYAKLVLSLQPVVYYRMEPTDDAQGRDAVFDSASGRHGTLGFSNAFGGSPYTTGHVGHALRFRGAMAGDHVTAAHYPPSATGRLAASAWVKATVRETWGAVAATWGRKPTGQFFLGFYRDTGQMAAGLIQQDGREVWASPSNSTESFSYGQWQHVAFSTDGTTLRLYLNGVEVGSCRHDGLLQKPAAAKLTIGCAIDDEASTDTDERYFCHWSGRIDELAVFNHPLTADQVMALYRGK